MDISETGGAAQQEDVYLIVRAAVESRRPISAVYHNRHRLFCPHRLGRNKEGQLRVLCYQYGGESESGLKPAGSPRTGAASRSIGSGAWNCLTERGKRRRTTHDPHPALSMQTWTRKTTRCAIRSRDSEAVNRRGCEP